MIIKAVLGLFGPIGYYIAPVHRARFATSLLTNHSAMMEINLLLHTYLSLFCAHTTITQLPNFGLPQGLTQNNRMVFRRK